MKPLDKDPEWKAINRAFRILQKATGDPEPCIFAIGTGDCPFVKMSPHDTIIAEIRRHKR